MTGTRPPARHALVRHRGGPRRGALLVALLALLVSSAVGMSAGQAAGAPANQPPIASDDTVSGPEDVPLTGNVLTNDSDAEGDKLSVSGHTDPANGTTVVNADGSFTYTPNADFNGTDTFDYTVVDGNGGTDTATLTIHITPVNDAPVATDDALTTAVDTPATGNVLTNDTDPENDHLTASQDSAPVNGTLRLSADGSFTYTPNAGYGGADSFTYKVCDDGAPELCDGGSVTITVDPGLPVNQAPTAVDDTFTTPTDTAVSGNVLTNDTDPEDDDLDASRATGPSRGTLDLSVDGSFTYTPDTGFHGADSFTYKVCDDGTRILCDTGTVTITVDPGGPVNQPPIAHDDAFTTAADTTVSGNVLTNDTDPESDPLIASLRIAPANGTIVLYADGSFTYKPNAGYAGDDTFIYNADDIGRPYDEVPTATVTITVNPAGPVNQAPIATDDAYTTTVDTTVSGNVLTNDTDPESDPLHATLRSGPTNGTVVLNADGSFNYAPNTGYVGDDTFVYAADDDGRPYDEVPTATVTITVNPVHHAPITHPDAYDAAAGTTLRVSDADGVLANDTDPDATTPAPSARAVVLARADAGLTAKVATGPLHGTLTMRTGGGFTYTPTRGYVGTDSFAYTASNLTTTSPPQRVTFRVSSADTAPVGSIGASTGDDPAPATGDDPAPATTDPPLPDTGGVQIGLLWLCTALIGGGLVLVRSRRRS